MTPSGRATAWRIAAVAAAVVLAVALIAVLRDPSAERLGRWALACFLIAAPLLWTRR